MVKKKTNGYGIASFIMGILALVLTFTYIGTVIFGILGIVFYVKQRKNSPSGLAIAGLAMSIIGLATITLVYLVIFLLG